MPPSFSSSKHSDLVFIYLAKAVLNGRGDEVIDLAKTNLFR